MEKINAQEMMEIYERQLKNAQQIQQRLIPDTDTFKSDHYSFYSYLKPYRRVGGDFYDFKCFDDGSISLILSDATGHGIDSAMLTCMIKLIYSYAMRNLEINKSPSKIIKRLDDDFEQILGLSFFSCFCLTLDPNTDRLFWNSAGHPPAILISDGQKITLLNAVLPLIGGHSLMNIKDYKDQFVEFKPGDKLILFTDGIYDQKNPQGQQFNINKVTEIIEDYKSESISTIIQVLKNANLEFAEGMDADDDICLLGIEYEK